MTITAIHKPKKITRNTDIHQLNTSNKVEDSDQTNKIDFGKTEPIDDINNNGDQEKTEKEREEQEKLQREKEEQERLQKEREELERLQREKKEQERLQKEREEQEKLQKEKEEQERLQKE